MSYNVKQCPLCKGRAICLEDEFVCADCGLHEYVGHDDTQDYNKESVVE